MPAHYGAPAGRESSSRLSRAALLGGIAPGMAVSRIWFAATKLRPPPLPHSAVPRPQLLDRLQTLALASRLTLLSAPAGYGKTTVLSAFAHAPGAWRVAWLTLDAEDSDPARFVAAVAAALQQLNPACGAITQALLESEVADLRPRRLAAALINDILETLPEPLALILDDLHVLTGPGILAALDYLIDHMPPQLHLVAATRTDPPLALARWRGRGQLGELRATELRFTTAETACYLNDLLGLHLAPADLQALWARTEGWPAGLCLLGQALGAREPRAEHAVFLRRLAGASHRLFDFLAEEIFAQQNEAVQRFLLETAVLAELTPARCAALTGRDDAAAVLADLHRRNLLLATNEASEPVYRYHPLLAEFLQRHLTITRGPESLAALHRRAALGEPLPARAMRHYLAAGMWAEAAATIETEGPQLLQQGQLSLLHDWLTALPEASRAERPRLAYLSGACALHRQEVAVASCHLRQAAAGFAAAGAAEHEGEALALLAQAEIFQTGFSQRLALLGRALACPSGPAPRAQRLLERASVLLWRGDYSAAQRDLADAWRLWHQAPSRELLHALLAHHQPGFLALPGELDRLETLCQEGEARFGETSEGSELLRQALDRQWGKVHQFRARLRPALLATESALAAGERLGGLAPWPFWLLTISLLALQLALGLRPPLAHYVDQLVYGLRFHSLAMEGLVYALTRLCLLAGEADQARRLLALVPESEANDWPVGHLYRAIVKGLFALIEGNLTAAVATLRQVVAWEAQQPVHNPLGCPRMLLAEALVAQGQPEAALVQVRHALIDCSQQGAPGRLLLECQHAVPGLRLAVDAGVEPALATALLHELATPPGSPAPLPPPWPIPGTGQVLTSREVQVLRLIAMGASNRVVADELIITERTVKNHVTNILAKLGVSSRTQAAIRAREWRLV